MTQDQLFTFLLRMGDHSMIIGQRLAEWCANAHILEEDIALANISLDHFGQADAWYKYAAEVEGKGRTHDDLAFKRDEREFYNFLICELPNGHYGDTIARQFLYDVFHVLQLQELIKSSDDRIAGIAAKGLKEAQYHVMHSTQWMLRLGDGTEESHHKMQESINNTMPFTGDIFEMDDVDTAVFENGIGYDAAALKGEWLQKVLEVLDESTLEMPENEFRQSGSKKGIHTEHLGHLLSEMQILQRSYPDWKWDA